MFSGLTLLNEFVNKIRFITTELDVTAVCVNILTRWLDQDVSDVDGEILNLIFLILISSN